MGDMHDITIPISATEWELVATRVMPSVADNEMGALGHLRLECAGTRHTWVGSDGPQMVTVDIEGESPCARGRATSSCEALVNPRLFRDRAPADGIIIIISRDGDRRRVALRTEELTVELAEFRGEYVDWKRHANATDFGRASALVAARLLRGAIESAGARPATIRDLNMVKANLEIRDGQLILSTCWHAVADVQVTLNATTDGSGAACVDEARLLALVTHLADGDADEHIEVLVSSRAHQPVGVRATNFTATLAQIDRITPARDQLETVLRGFLHTSELPTNEDDDYVISSDDGPRMWARLVNHHEVTVHVFSVVAYDVEASLELYAEVNVINLATPHVKIVLEDGALMASADLVAAGLHERQLASAVRSVSEAVSTYQPLLKPMFTATPAASGPDSGNTTDDTTDDTTENDVI